MQAEKQVWSIKGNDTADTSRLKPARPGGFVFLLQIRFIFVMNRKRFKLYPRKTLAYQCLKEPYNSIEYWEAASQISMASISIQSRINPLICLIHHKKALSGRGSKTSAKPVIFTTGVQVQVGASSVFMHGYCKYTVLIMDDDVVF